LQCQAPTINVRRLLFVLNGSSSQVSSSEKACDCRIIDCARKRQRGAGSGRIGRTDGADLRERRHLLNVRSQVIQHRMLVENPETATDGELLGSGSESESKTRAEALEGRVRVEVVHRAESWERGVQLLRLLGEVHA